MWTPGRKPRAPSEQIIWSVRIMPLNRAACRAVEQVEALEHPHLSRLMPDAEVTLTSIREGMIVEILGRYQRLGVHERHALVLAFDYTKDKLELEYGDFAGWRDEHKTDLADKLMKVAEEFIGEDPDWACGAGLLSLYLEAQTFPTDDAREMVLRIEDWYRTAIETEFCRLP